MRISIGVAMGVGVHGAPVGSSETGLQYKAFVAAEVPKCFEEVETALSLVSNQRCERITDLRVTMADGSTFEVTQNDYIVARTARDKASYCTKRALLRSVANIPGVALREVREVIHLPAACVGRAVVYEPLRKFPLSSVQAPEAYNRAAELLDALAAMHESGFVHYGFSTGEPVIGIDKEGRATIGHLQSVRGLFTSAGEPKDDIDQLVRDDIKFLVSIHLQQWITDPELWEAIDESARKSAPTQGRPFNYSFWAEVLRRKGADAKNIDFPRSPMGHRVFMHGAHLVATFNQLKAHCLAEIPVPAPECLAEEGCECPPSEPFLVEQLGEMRIRDPHSLDGDFSGMYGRVYTMADNKLALMKVLFELGDKKSAESVCTEKSMLRVLKGLGGLAPRMLEIRSGVNEKCQMRAFVMEQVGSKKEIHETDRWNSAKRAFYKIIAKSLEMLRTLHETGFIHGDMNVHNIKMDNVDNIYEALWLIDFGLSKPYVDEAGSHLLDPEASRRIDMERFADELADSRTPPASTKATIREFRDAMFALGREERPDYEKWIAVFKEMAKSNDLSDRYTDDDDDD
jgi:RIO-like serine/threonine protein kinase